MGDPVMVVSTVSDDPFGIDVAHFMGQTAEVPDLIGLKVFANTEFCPRFISDERDVENIGQRLTGQAVVIVSTCCGQNTRNCLAMRNCLVARAAKDNGAASVWLVEPDLFYSAQDRGPRPDQGHVDFERTVEDYKKFDGQAFSARLYAELLRTSGVDGVITVHNHSLSVQRLYSQLFEGRFHNLSPAGLFCNYLLRQNVLQSVGRASGVALCAPDGGAAGFVRTIHEAIRNASAGLLLPPAVGLLLMAKDRKGERNVHVHPSPDSPLQMGDIENRDVIVFDDMVRTGHTIVECCRLLKEAGARTVTFVVTHFNSSEEVKANLNSPAIDEIVTTNTLPSVLNRDMQGRLRKKMLVLKIEKWIARDLAETLGVSPGPHCVPPYYTIDMSSKNPRAQHRI